MTRPEGPEPPLPERFRMPLRVGAVFIGWLIYVLVDGPLVGRVLLWVGFIALAWALIEKMTTFKQQQLSLMLAAQAFLGVGLLVAGGFLVFR